jgi:hypothetical protein
LFTLHFSPEFITVPSLPSFPSSAKDKETKGGNRPVEIPVRSDLPQKGAEFTKGFLRLLRIFAAKNKRIRGVSRTILLIH